MNRGLRQSKSILTRDIIRTDCGCLFGIWHAAKEWLSIYIKAAATELPDSVRALPRWQGCNAWHVDYSRIAMRLSACCLTVVFAFWFGPATAVAEPGVTVNSIVFGQAAALEGPASALGRDMRQGILAAFAEVNTGGGVYGRKLELLSRDDGYEPNKSIDAVKRLIEEDHVFALVGPVGTPTSLATQPIATAAGVPFIGPFTGADFLRNPFKPNVINVRASYFQETEAMVERLTTDLGIERIAILYQDDAFGRAGLAGVQKALEQRSMTLVSEGTFERNTTAVKRALLSIRAGNPEAVIMIGPYQPCAAFIKLAREHGLDAVFVNISFVGSNALAKALGSSGDGVVITQVVPFPGDSSIPLIARYQAALRLNDARAEPGFVTLEGYLVGRLVVAALERMGPEPTRKALIDTISGSSFDFEGFKLVYRANDNQGSNEVYLTVIRADQSFTPITNLQEAIPDKRPDRQARQLTR
jgi:branched-chain amino acid transport system substrate-binding protein